MATNSDSIYYVMSKLRRHPDLISWQKPHYDNAVRLCFPDSVNIADAQGYFPDERISNSLLSQDFLSENGDLLDFYFAKTKAGNPDYKQVWLMTSHLTDRHVYLMEFSFE